MASIAQVQIADPPRSRRSHPELDVLCPTTMTTTTTTTITTARSDPNQGLAEFEAQMQSAVQTLSDMMRQRKTIPDAVAKECRVALAQAEGHLGGVAEHARNNRPTWTSCLFSRRGKRCEREAKLRRFVAAVRASFESLEGRCGRAEKTLAGIREKALALSEELARGPWTTVCELKARRLEMDKCASGRAPRDAEPGKAAVLRAHIAVKLALTKLGELVSELEDEEAGLGVVRDKCAFVARRLGFVLEEEDLAGLIWGLKYAVEDVQAWDTRLETKPEEKGVSTEKKPSSSTKSVDTLARASFLMLRG